MAKFSETRKSIATRLGVERLEARAMCALSPVHVVIPTMGVFGSTLETDGSVEIYGDANQWKVGADGRQVSTKALDPDVGQATRHVLAVSPDGKWMVGTTEPQIPGEQGPLVAWQSGSAINIVVALPQDIVNSPHEVHISDSGIVTYIVDSSAGGQRSWVWSQSGRLTQLQSLYEVGGNTNQGASDANERAISADGRTVVGFSGGGTFPTRPTMWIDGIPQELPKGNAPGGMALSISSDGRIVGGNVNDGNVFRPRYGWTVNCSD